MSAQTRIAIVSDAVLPFNKGGKETRIAHIAEGLVQAGFQVDIYTMQWWHHGKTYVENGITYHAISRRYNLYKGDRRSIFQGIMFGLACLKLIRYNFDVMDVDHMPFFPLFSAKIVCILRRKPLYATWHEVWGLNYWREYLGKLGNIAYIVERLSVLLPNHIIAVSKHTARELTDKLHYSGPISVVPNGINTAHFASVKPSKLRSDVIYSGRLLPNKNVNLLIDAMAIVKQSHPKLTCTIIGEGPEYAALQTQVQELKLGETIQLLGRLESHDEVIARMKAADVFVLASNREGFGIVVLEAAACGLSVVTVDTPANAAKDLVGDTLGIVCQPTAAAIAQSIIKLHAEPRIATSVQSFDWSAAHEQLKKVYA